MHEWHPSRIFRCPFRVSVRLLAVLVLSTGCFPGQQAARAPQIPLTIQLSWTPDFQFAPLYAAEHNGHFAAEDLAVTLKPGGFQGGAFVNVLDSLLNGTADFALIDAYGAIQARARQQPVVAVGALYQRSPSSIISLRRDNITRPRDLIGKRLELTPNAATWTYQGMLVTQGIALDQIQTGPRSPSSIDRLIAGQLDAITGWVINENIQLQEAGYETNVIVMGDYGTDTHTVLLATTEKTIAERPATVEKFVRAVAKGVRDTVSRPNDVAALALRHDPKLDEAGQRRRLQAALPFILPAGSQPLAMSVDVWEATHRLLLDQGVLPAPIEIEKAYTLSFVERAGSPRP